MDTPMIYKGYIHDNRSIIVLVAILDRESQFILSFNFMIRIYIQKRKFNKKIIFSILESFINNIYSLFSEHGLKRSASTPTPAKGRSVEVLDTGSTDNGLHPKPELVSPVKV